MAPPLFQVVVPLQPTEYRYEPTEKCWWFCLRPTVLCVSQVVSLPTPQASERSVPLGHLVFQRTSRAQVLEICSLYPRGFWKLNFPQSPAPSSGRNCSLYLTNADCSSAVCWEPRCLSNVPPSLGASRLLQQGSEEAATPAQVRMASVGCFPALLLCSLGRRAWDSSPELLCFPFSW